jgi:hypothetical protein
MRTWSEELTPEVLNQHFGWHSLAPQSAVTHRTLKVSINTLEFWYIYIHYTDMGYTFEMNNFSIFTWWLVIGLHVTCNMKCLAQGLIHWTGVISLSVLKPSVKLALGYRNMIIFFIMAATFFLSARVVSLVTTRPICREWPVHHKVISGRLEFMRYWPPNTILIFHFKWVCQSTVLLCTLWV